MLFKDYYLSLSRKERLRLACLSGTKHTNLRNIAYGGGRASIELAARIVLASDGAVTCEEVCPAVNWDLVRLALSSHPKRVL